MKSGPCLCVALLSLTFVGSIGRSQDELEALRDTWVFHQFNRSASKADWSRISAAQGRLTGQAVAEVGLSKLVRAAIADVHFVNEVSPHLFSRALRDGEWELATSLLANFDPHTLSPIWNIEAFLVLDVDDKDIKERIEVLLGALDETRSMPQNGVLHEALDRAFGRLFDRQDPGLSVEAVRARMKRAARVVPNPAYPREWSEVLFEPEGGWEAIVQFEEKDGEGK